MQNVQSLLFTFKMPKHLVNLNNFAILTGVASALANGYTYSYFHTESRNGEECCRPIKSKCDVNENFGNTCKITRGQNECGKGCSRIIKSLEKLERREKKEKEKKKHSSVHKDVDQSGSFRHGPSKSETSPGFDEYSYEEFSNEQRNFEAGKGLKVKKGQKLDQRKLEMLVAATEEKQQPSTNPLCKDNFRFLNSRTSSVMYACSIFRCFRFSNQVLKMWSHLYGIQPSGCLSLSFLGSKKIEISTFEEILQDP